MNSLGSLLVLAGAVFCVSADDGWVPIAGRYFKFFDTPMSFADARATCNGLGGIVAYDDHPAVNQHIAKSSKKYHLAHMSSGTF